MKKISIIGGGPAALMLAAQLDPQKYRVTIFEKKKAVGRKFLVAGEGGLNLTFNSSVEELVNQYHPSEFTKPILKKFSNEDLRKWLDQLEVPTWSGSSNRVFPEEGMKPFEVLKKIVDYIESKGVEFKLNTEWLGWDAEGQLCFEGIDTFKSDLVVFALGGASWKVTGSDGTWKNHFEKQGLNIVPFQAANCAFEVDWSKNFITTHEGKPLKNIALSFDNIDLKGELTVSKFGLEGNAIYPLSQAIQEKLSQGQEAVVHLDLKPSLTEKQLLSKYKKSKETKVTGILTEELNMDRTSIGLIKHFTDKDTFANPDLLVKKIKALPIPLLSAANIDEAISTLGGLDLKEIDEHFQLRKIPMSYAIGEMLDWYAPTGGYLLQGCFSMGFALAEYLNGLEDTEN
jgi:uncharacterized flavoprotein (TIGR03862 family)